MGVGMLNGCLNRIPEFSSKNRGLKERATTILHRFSRKKKRNRMSIENLGIFFFLVVLKLKPKDCLVYKGEINRLLVVQSNLLII